MLNIDVVKYEFTKFIFEDALIKEVQAKLNQNSKKMIENSFSSFIIWASSEKSVELDALKTEGNFSFTKEKSKSWLELLQIYYDNSLLK